MIDKLGSVLYETVHIRNPRMLKKTVPSVSLLPQFSDSKAWTQFQQKTAFSMSILFQHICLEKTAC